MTIKQHESPFHATHDKEAADKMAADVDAEICLGDFPRGTSLDDIEVTGYYMEPGIEESVTQPDSFQTLSIINGEVDAVETHWPPELKCVTKVLTPSKHAKSLGAKNLLEVATSYDMHSSTLEKIHRTDQARFERMVKVHVMAKEMMIRPQHLEFMLESVVSNLKNTKAADHFINNEGSREELTRAYVVDFRVRMRDMCQTLLLNEQAKGDFREVVYNLLKGGE